MKTGVLVKNHFMENERTKDAHHSTQRVMGQARDISQRAMVSIDGGNGGMWGTGICTVSQMVVCESTG